MADPYVLVISASNPNYSNLEEFVEYAKANPGVVKMADSGVGAAPNVAANSRNHHSLKDARWNLPMSEPK